MTKTNKTIGNGNKMASKQRRKGKNEKVTKPTKHSKKQTEKKKFPTKVAKNNGKANNVQHKKAKKEEEDLETFEDEADADFDYGFLLNIDPDKLEHVPTRRKINAEKRQQTEEEKKRLELENKQQEPQIEEETLESNYERQYFEEKEKEEEEKEKQDQEKQKQKETSKFKRKRKETKEVNHDEVTSDNEEREAKKQKKSKKEKNSEEKDKRTDVLNASEIEKLILSDELLRKQRFREKQEIIASIATDILAEPVINIKKLDDLIALCTDADNDVKKIALLSIASLFKDLIPSYRINMDLLTDMQGNRLSKEVKELHHFEIGLLKAYQKFLSLATTHARKYASKLQIACVKSLSELLVTHPHFNYTQLIIDILIPLMNSNYSRRNESAIHRRKEKVSILIFEHICKLFANDITQGEVSLDVVEVISNFIMKRQYQVSTRLVDCFLSLPLKTMITDKSLPTKIQNKNKKKKTGKKAKDLTLNDAVSRDFNEANAKVSQSHIKQIQGDTLRNIIVIYVRALKSITFQLAEETKQGVKQKINEPNIVFCSLAGLAKFAHLMNIDLLYDLLDYIRTILTAANDDLEGDSIDTRLELRVDIVLQSLITAAKLMEGLGAAIDIDPRDFYAQLYAVIPTVFQSLMGRTDIDNQEEDEYRDRLIRLFVDAVHRLLLVPNLTHSSRLPIGRICAFIKRICSYCYAFSSPQYIHLSIVSMKLCSELIRKYPQAMKLLETPGDEEGAIGGLGGIYDALTDDPDSANANGSVLWELYNLGLPYHYHPQCREQAKEFLQLVQKGPKELKSFAYQELITNYNPFTMDAGKNNGIRFAPPVRAPETPRVEKKYEKLQARLNSDKVSSKLKQKLPDSVYITPSIYASTKSSQFFRDGFEMLKKSKLSIAQILGNKE